MANYCLNDCIDFRTCLSKNPTSSLRNTEFPQCFDCSDSISSAFFPLTALIKAVTSDFFGAMSNITCFQCSSCKARCRKLVSVPISLMERPFIQNQNNTFRKKAIKCKPHWGLHLSAVPSLVHGSNCLEEQTENSPRSSENHPIICKRNEVC